MKKYNKDLHERLRHRTGLYCYNDNIGVDSDDIDALLDELERLQSESRWIPVSENPKTTDVYYTYCKANGHKWSEENNYIVGAGWSNKFVAHWRPLPQPPESEDYMISIHDMTDEQLNEAIAKKRGWKKCTCEWCQKSSTPFWINPGENSTEDLPDATLDWNLAGGLLEELPSDARARVVIVSPNEMKRAICEEWLVQNE